MLAIGCDRLGDVVLLRRWSATSSIRAWKASSAAALPSGAKGKHVKKVSLTSSMGPGLKIDMAEVEGA